MIRHAVVVTLKDDADESRIQEVIAILAALPAEIPEIASSSVGRGLTPAGDPAARIGIVSEFATIADLNTYLTHPAHVASGVALRDVMQTAVFADFEVDE